ncbi:hypothetical protein LIER_18655 [Lithospermum erythrorhizon]|uniref:Uncharacterized protein n=1 Tax=Lithospermum erythrorhizon TaxID=34254 RepID=A0AAV3QES5_LITER
MDLVPDCEKKMDSETSTRMAVGREEGNPDMPITWEGYYHSPLSSVESTSYENCNPEDKSTWANMLFASPEAAQIFYESHARSIGFKT